MGFPHRTPPAYAPGVAEQSKTVDQALRVLFEIRRGGAGSATELGRRLGLSRQAVLRVVSTLEAHGVVRRRGNHYELGAGLVELASGLERQLRADAQGALTDLVREFGETAVLTIRQGDQAVPIEQVTSPDRMIRIQYQPGQRHPLDQTAHGRSLLVGLRVTELRMLGIDPAGVADDLARLDELGYLTSHDELEEGAAGLAAPVRGADGRAVASIGIVAPSVRFPDERAVARSVRRAAAEVAKRHLGQTRTVG